jgi:hypothetical protein
MKEGYYTTALDGTIKVSVLAETTVGNLVIVRKEIGATFFGGIQMRIVGNEEVTYEDENPVFYEKNIPMAKFQDRLNADPRV